MKTLLLAIATSTGLVACSSDQPEPPKIVSELAVSIDAANNCSVEDTPVQCERVAEVIKTRYPTSKPRVDICLDKQARYEAAVEVMNSVSAAGLTVGKFECGKTSG
jgi:biopolymer transport protein ExbD